MEELTKASRPSNVMDTEENVEMTMASARNYLVCPVCVETLTPPIFQCFNGHVVCSACIARVDKCAECRQKLCQSNKIRNLALEKIINNLCVYCSNKDDGCSVKVTVACLKDHLKVCSYTPFNFCSQVLGSKDCKDSVNDISVLSHLEACHAITKVKSSTFRMCLNVSQIPMDGTNFFFEPLLVTSMAVPIIIRSVVSTNGYFTFTGLTLKTETEHLENIRLKFRIESETKQSSFEWSGYVQPYRAFNETNIVNSCRIPVDSLIEFWGPNARIQEVTAISIVVSVWEKTTSSQDYTLHEEVHIFEQSIRQKSSVQNIPDQYSGISLSASQPIWTGIFASQSNESIPLNSQISEIEPDFHSFDVEYDELEFVG